MDITEEVIAHLKNNIKTKMGVSSIDGGGVIAIKYGIMKLGFI